MSRRLQDLFWDCELTSTEQLVAQRLAWHANDEDGRCWPSIRTLAAKTGLSDRAVQKATKALETGGHLSREERFGVGMIYIVHPRTSCTGSAAEQRVMAQGGNPKALTPEPSSPVDLPAPVEAELVTPERDAPRATFTPERSSPHPRTSCTQTVQEPINTDDGGARATPKRATARERGSRIAVDWRPTLPLPPKLQSAVDAWPPGRLDGIVDEFRDYWLAASGQTAVKHDWDRTFHNRIRAVIERDQERGQRRHGQRPAAHRPPDAEYRDPLFRRVAEGRDPYVDQHGRAR